MLFLKVSASPATKNPHHVPRLREYEPVERRIGQGSDFPTRLLGIGMLFSAKLHRHARIHSCKSGRTCFLVQQLFHCYPKGMLHERSLQTERSCLGSKQCNISSTP